MGDDHRTDLVVVRDKDEKSIGELITSLISECGLFPIPFSSQ